MILVRKSGSTRASASKTAIASPLDISKPSFSTKPFPFPDLGGTLVITFK